MSHAAARRSWTRQDARRLFERFTGHDAEHTIRYELPADLLKDPPPLAFLGLCTRIDYLAIKRPEGPDPVEFFHHFVNPPLLGAHPSGAGLLVLAGDFRVRSAGITG